MPALLFPGYLPGWEIPKLTPESFSRDYGFITVYFCEIMHDLRHLDLLSQIRPRFQLIDLARTPTGISGRDQRAVMKTLSGLTKIMYPHEGFMSLDIEISSFCCAGNYHPALTLTVSKALSVINLPRPQLIVQVVKILNMIW